MRFDASARILYCHTISLKLIASEINSELKELTKFETLKIYAEFNCLFYQCPDGRNPIPFCCYIYEYEKL